jgi:ATP/maltotriose-dependent transcriptional regulator MalT
VLELLASGGGYADIARSLKIELNTVRTRVRSIYEKLGGPEPRRSGQRWLDLGLLRRPTS